MRKTSPTSMVCFLWKDPNAKDPRVVHVLAHSQELTAEARCELALLSLWASTRLTPWRVGRRVVPCASTEHGQEGQRREQFSVQISRIEFEGRNGKATEWVVHAVADLSEKSLLAGSARVAPGSVPDVLTHEPRHGESPKEPPGPQSAVRKPQLGRAEWAGVVSSGFVASEALSHLAWTASAFRFAFSAPLSNHITSMNTVPSC